MWFEINVAFHGDHFFATHERSLPGLATAEKVLKVFKEKFPESEGYEIRMTCNKHTCEEIDVNE